MAIAPDSKDWTWVLERRCPDCGFDAATVARQDVSQLLRENAATWQLVLARDDARRRFRDDMWSPLEYGCHVRDVYRVMDGRLELMLREDDPTFPNWDQDATAAEDTYDMQDPAQVAVELVAAADRLAARFEAVGGDQWSRPGQRSNGSSFTVESLARYAVHDLVHHVYDVRTFGIAV